MTTIHIHDPKAVDAVLAAKLTPLPMAALAIAIYNLLDEAADLPQPQEISMSELQLVDMQFAPTVSSLRAIARWALRFGGVLTSEPHQTANGPQTWCRVKFDYYGLAVKAYAHIPAATAT